MNPYELLGIPRNATDAQIEDAYDALFDQYEPLAMDGDEQAVDMLNELNVARDSLLDPRRREKIDAMTAAPERPGSKKEAQAAPQPRPRRQERPPQQRDQSPRPPRPQGRSGSMTVRTRRRASYVIEQPRPTRSLMSYMPYFVAFVVLAFAMAVGITFLLNRQSCVPADLPTGATVASVNSVPIYQRELDVREQIDKSGALSDPLFSSFFDPSTITGTRALDTLKFDSLDKLVNMEVILQQARKEGIWPTEEQQVELVNQAARGDQQPGESFEDMLCRIQISENKYKRTVIENVVYTVMANEHMPKDGDAATRTDGFIKWICDTREDYDVQIMMQFLVTNNPPCTSGLPSDVPLPGLETTPVPEDVPTAVLPAQTTPTVPSAEPTSAP